MIFTLSVIAVVSLGGVFWLFASQTVKMSRGEVAISDGSNIHRLIEPLIDYFAFQFVVWCRDNGRKLALLVLSFAHEVATLGRKFSAYLEHRFAKLIDLVKGRGIPNNRGAVSFFLREIDEYKKTLSRNQ